MNTARITSTAVRIGTATSAAAAASVRSRGCRPLVQPVGEVLDHDDAGVDEQADGDRQPAERHGVEAEPEQAQRHRGAQRGERQERDDDRAARQLPSNTTSTAATKRAPMSSALTTPPSAWSTSSPLVVEEVQRHAGRQRASQPGQRPRTRRAVDSVSAVGCLTTRIDTTSSPW